MQEYLTSVSIVGVATPKNDSSRYASQEAWFQGLKQDEVIISIIHGFPNPQVLQCLGLYYELYPLDLLRHLQFPGQQPGFQVNPGLASDKTSSFSVRIVSLGHTSQDLYSHEQSIIKKQREIQANLEDYNLDAFTSVTVGRECYRKVTVHGRRHFSIEQQATVFIVNKIKPSWSAVLLSDCGEPTSRPPWQIGTSKDDDTWFYPIDEHRFLLSDRPQKGSSNWSSSLPRRHPDPFKSRLNINQELNDEDIVIACEDPFFLTCNILRTAAISWSQLLDFIGEPGNTITNDSEFRVEQLQQNKQFVDDAARHFEEILAFVQRKGDTDWPRCSTVDRIGRVDREAKALEIDFRSLREQAKQISAQCSDSSTTIFSIINIKEAKEAMVRSRRLEQLTMLAFLFTPLNLIASCFGMNVQQLQSHQPSIWLYFTVSVPVTIAFMLIPSWPLVRRLGVRIRDAVAA